MIVRWLIDSDGLIKLHRAGILAQVVSTFYCAIPQAVFDEVITKGKQRLHQDADEIEAIISDRVSILPAQGRPQPERGLGAGELGILSLMTEDQDTVVVSDDRRFLVVLTMQGSEFLTPADVLVVLARRRVLTRDEARDALDRLRPVIRPAAYWETRQDLEFGGGIHEEE